jgi:hypothetical protein
MNKVFFDFAGSLPENDSWERKVAISVETMGSSESFLTKSGLLTQMLSCGGESCGMQP